MDLEQFKAEILEELRTTGWIKGQMYDSEGKACLLGAIDRIYQRANEERVVGLVSCERILRDTLPEWAQTSLSVFNDHPDTSWEDIERFLS